VFEGDSWEDFKELREQDKKLYSGFCRLLNELLLDEPSKGLGKPMPLSCELSGLWSRRLSQKDRAIYKYDSESIYIFAIGG